MDEKCLVSSFDANISVDNIIGQYCFVVSEVIMLDYALIASQGRNRS